MERFYAQAQLLFFGLLPITGLHGLHVLAGVIVFSYFFFSGKSSTA